MAFAGKSFHARKDYDNRAREIIMHDKSFASVFVLRYVNSQIEGLRSLPQKVVYGSMDTMKPQWSGIRNFATLHILCG